MKHTPGPWKVSGTERGDEYRSVILGGPHNATVAHADLLFYSDLDECEANARLISAAPELLEALTAIMTILNNNSTTEFEQRALHSQPSIQMAVAAIKKATDENP